jgi:tRNA(His) 5'-end guanylyltransferase
MEDRMRSYEQSAEQVLPPGLPIILRLDGNSFSNLTDEHFKKPFDPEFEELMNAAATGALEYCTQAELAFIQSDEISLLLPPADDNFASGRTQKLASLLAGHASAKFTAEFGSPAAFDCRAFVMPKGEVNDYFIWRQEDAFRNCVHSVAFYELVEEGDRSYATEVLHGMSMPEKQELLWSEFDINVDKIPTHRKRGRCIYREDFEVPIEDWMEKSKYDELLEKGYIQKGDTVERSRWKTDRELPRFTKNPYYIDEYLFQINPQVA